MVGIPENRIFSCVFPTGISYADRTVEDRRTRDYKRLAFLPFATLELEVEKECPPDLLTEIREDAAKIQARRGQPFQVSSCNQTVILGKR